MARKLPLVFLAVLTATCFVMANVAYSESPLILDMPDPRPGARFGTSVASGDANGDAIVDIAVGAIGGYIGANQHQGRAYLFSGDSLSLLYTFDTPNPQSGGDFGRSIVMGDADGDARADVAVGAPGESTASTLQQGRVYLFSGGTGGLLMTLTTPEPRHFAQFGGILAVGDVNGDGKADIVAGVPYREISGNPLPGRVFVFDGSNGELLWTLASPNTEGEESFGFSVATGDADRDGRADIAVGAREESVNGNVFQGRAYLFSGATGGLLRTLDTPSPKAGVYFGFTVAMSDVDGDGYSDINVVSPGDRGILIFSGLSGVLMRALPTPQPLDEFATAMTTGDVDGDGRKDIAFNYGSSNRERVYVHSAATGVFTWIVDAIPQTQTNFGDSLAMENIAGDSGADLVIGAPYEDWQYGTQGRVYIFPCEDADRDSRNDCADRDDDNDGAEDRVEGECGDGHDQGGNGLVNDGCPQVGPAAETSFQCSDADDNDGDGWMNDGCPGSETAACGSNAYSATSRPERIDTPDDDDGDGLLDEALPAGSEAYDCDGDGFAGALEQYVFSAANTASDQKKCGVDAWPADINNDGYSDITDFGAVVGSFGEAVPPAPARKDIAPDPPDGFVGISDIGGMAGLFGRGCS